MKKFIIKNLSYFYQISRKYIEVALAITNSHPVGYNWKRVESFFAYGCVLSFPKCGRTWMKTIFFNTLPVDNYIVSRALLSKGIFSRNFLDVIFNKKKFIGFTHDPRFAILNINKTVFLIRHPFDAIVSLYHHQKYKSSIIDEESIDKFFLEKLSDILIFYKALVPFFLEKGRLIKYEDIHKEPYLGFSKTLERLNCDFETEKLKNVIENNNFEALQKKEIKKMIKRKRFNSDEINISRLKFRKGKINTYKYELKPETIEEGKAISRRIFSYDLIKNKTNEFLADYDIFSKF